MGRYGGSYVPEILVEPLARLERDWALAWEESPEFRQEWLIQLQHYAGRPTPLTEVPRYAEAIGAPRLFLKREDLLHTGAHKLNNALGQVILAEMMGKRRVIAETGAGQHGVATATACARLGMPCSIYMGRVDMERQALNVKRIELLGAEIIPVDQGSSTLKDAISEAMRDWSAHDQETHYCLGSVVGPHPYPTMVRELQRIIGIETKEQIYEIMGTLPTHLIACVGGGSNAMGFFYDFLEEEEVELIGVEAGGEGDALGENASRFLAGTPGILHGTYTFILQDGVGQVVPSHSIAAGLDYPSVGPEHAALYESGRATYVSVRDLEAVEQMRLLSETEGIIPALESSFALAYLAEIAPAMGEGVVIINLSGRGDKDLGELMQEGIL